YFWFQNETIQQSTKTSHSDSLRLVCWKIIFFKQPNNNNRCYLILQQTEVSTFEGESLNLTRISRTEMGAYLCIASNGVPPSVSKRIIVDVECEYRYHFS
ncbi:hypothetical protein LSTR_LSTR014654, partial [Laodelphax striatellus]